MEYKDLLVRDAMTRNPVTIQSNATVLRASQKMLEKKVGGLVVVNNDRVEGMITKTDILEKAVLKNRDPAKTLVRDVMTKNFVSVGPHTRITQAAELMVKYNIRRLPVIKNKTLQGLITQTDLLKIQPTILDLLIHKFNTEHAPEYDVRNLSSVKGFCDVCGNFENLKNSSIGFICKQCNEANIT